jgi:hypothetical protein
MIVGDGSNLRSLVVVRQEQEKGNEVGRAVRDPETPARTHAIPRSKPRSGNTINLKIRGNTEKFSTWAELTCSSLVY